MSLLRACQTPEVLAIAAASGRILVTHDARTMPQHFADFLTLHDSPGVVLVPKRLAMAQAIHDLVLIWSASDPNDWRGVLTRLPL